MKSDDTIEARLGALDGILKRIGNRVSLLHSALPVDADELKADAGGAVTLVDAIRVAVRELADQAHAEEPRWATREQLIHLVAKLREAAILVANVEKRAAKLRSVAEGIEAGRVFNRSKALEAASEKLRLLACQELFGAASDPGGPSLPGPDAFGSWIEWAAENIEEIRSARLPETAAFSEILPDGFLPAVCQGELRPDGEIGPRSADGTESDGAGLQEGLAEPSPAEGLDSDDAAQLEGEEGGNGPDRAGDAQPTAVSEELPATPADDRQRHATTAVTRPATVRTGGESGDRIEDEPRHEGPQWTPATDRAESREAARSGRRSEDLVVPRGAPNLWKPTRLPEVLTSFEAFEAKFWMGSEGRCQAAPWVEKEGFSETLRSRLGVLLEAEVPRLREVWIFSTAGEALGRGDFPEPILIRLLAEAWNRPAAAFAILANVPHLDMGGAVTEGKVAPNERWRLRVLAEALSPSPDANASWVAQDLVKAAGFVNPVVQQSLEWLLKNGGSGDPIGLLRRAMPEQENSGETPEQLRERLSIARAELHEFVRGNWSACGGNIERTHCREAWARFMERVQPRLQELFPQPKRGQAVWDSRKAGAFIEALPAIHAEIADAAGAGLKDRRKMDRTVERLREVASEVNDLYRRLEESTRLSTMQKHASSADQEIRRILTTSMPDRDEAFVVRLLRRIVAGAPGQEKNAVPLGIDAELICACPGLLACLRRGPGVRDGADAEVPIGSIEAAVTASAALLAQEERASRKIQDVAGELRVALSGVREVLRTRIGGLVSEEERKRLEAQWLEVAEKQIERGERAWILLAAAGVPLKGGIRTALDDARRRAKEAGARPLDPALFLEWLAQLSAAADGIVSETKTHILAGAQGLDADLRDAVTAAVNENRIGAAVRLLSGTDATVDAGATSRETLWRQDAARQFPDPIVALRKLQSAVPSLRPLLNRWIGGIQAEEAQDKLLRAEVNSTLLQTVGIAMKSSVGALRIPGPALKDWFRRGQYNPACVPQISELVLATPPVKVSDRTFAQSTASLAANLGAGGESLVGILAPRVDAEVRKDTLRELRTRRLKAAIVDDLDLCRIVTPGGRAVNAVFALLEVVLEQLPLAAVSPFLVPEGQNVQMEMYFGRKREARDLVMSPRFSRLFSGRKLGKSALLKYVEATYDREKLPSGNTLRVLYVSAVGVDSEAGLATRISDAFRDSLSWPKKAGTTHVATEPGRSLETLLSGYLRAHERESLLVVLDEADVFIEHQIEEYRTNLERCLSFLMRSRIEAEKDAHGLPRVRFVFAGYRVANTTEGAWANWGDVLRLSPLDPADAIDLIGRPLARIGVDASEQAPAIAHRCGYQPAVLLRFGEQLLRVLDRSARSQDRTRAVTVVREDDVIQTMEGEPVQEEIRTVVKNNFQGNRAASLIFAILLREFLDSGPGHAIEAPEEVVLERIRSYSGDDLRWLSPRSGGAGPEVVRILKDLVERQLVAERREGPGRPRALLMKFPHHLPVLESLAHEDWIQAEIEGLQREEPIRKDEPAVTSFFSGAQLDRLADLDPADEEEFRPVQVVGTHWQDYVTNRTVGLPDRLGFGDARTVEEQAGQVLALRNGNGRRLLVAHATPEGVRRACETAKLGDRIPLFCGGVDLLRWAISGEMTQLAVAAGAPALLDVAVGLRRLTRAAVSWWFARFRGLNFPEADAIETIMMCTAGIPILVREMDAALVGQDGSRVGVNLTTDLWDKGLRDFKASVKKVAADLQAGPLHTRLTGRELEILGMAATVRKVGPMDTLAKDLGELSWELYADQLEAAPLGLGDGLSLRVLMGSGLLPSRGEGAGDPFEDLGDLRENDPIVELAAEFQG